MKHVVALIIGAIIKTTRSAAAGIKSSFKAIFTPSTSPCKIPNGPTRLGPLRTCINATMRRSPQIARIVRTTHAAKINTPLSAMIPPGSLAINSALVNGASFMLSPPILQCRSPRQVEQWREKTVNYEESRLFYYQYQQFLPAR